MPCQRGCEHDIFILVKMHFFHVKSNILCKRSNILRKFYVTMFTPEHSLFRRSIPLLPPGPQYHPARLPTLPASPPCRPAHPARQPTQPATRTCPPSHQAHHPSKPATSPCQPAFPDSPALLLSQDSVARVATR